MLVKNLGKIDNYEKQIDTAFSRASKHVEEFRDKVKGKDRIVKSKTLEIERVKTVKKELVSSLERIFDSNPKFDELHPFYIEIISLYHDVGKLRKSLAATQWAKKKIERLEHEHTLLIKKAISVKDINPLRNAFLGRVNSIMKQISKDFLMLEEFRRFTRWLPAIKTGIFTVCISGFPNVGKSTLLSKISGAKPEIDSYAFTTRRLNLGYIKKEIQLIDTPGTLNRFNKMNDIEKLAYVAMKNLANCIIYVYDKMEEYPWEDQKMLAQNLKDFKVPMIYYLSKTDLLNQEQIEEVKKEIPGIIVDKDELIAKMEDMKDKYVPPLPPKEEEDEKEEEDSENSE